MASASASPQPPSDRPDTAGREEPGSDATRREALEASESDATRREGNDPYERAKEGHAAYGPLSIERHVKQDGRALILYARVEDQAR